MSQKKIVRVCDLDYIDKKDHTIVRLVGRDENGERTRHKIEGTYPCLWVREEYQIPAEIKQKYVKEINFNFETYDGIPVKQLVTYVPSQVNRIMEQVEDHWEADIPYVRRVSVDHGLTGYVKIPDSNTIHIDDVESLSSEDAPNIEPRVFIADIETLPPEKDSGGFEEYTQQASEPVLMITVYDTYDDEYTVLVRDPDDYIRGNDVRDHLSAHWRGHDDHKKYSKCNINLVRTTTEEELLRSYVSLVDDKRPDLISGWNWVNFDHRYLLNRLEQFADVDETKLSEFRDIGGYSYERKITGLPAFDMMGAYCDQMTFHDWRSRALDYVSNEVLGVGKVDDISIKDNYYNDRSKLLAYNIIDVQLTVALDDMFGVHEFFYLLAELSGVQIYDTFSAMRLVDGFLLSRRNRDEILPSTTEKELDANAGGLVLKPSDKISEWVGVWDLKSLYPSTIITGNISTETLTNDPDEADITIPWMPEKEEDVPGQTIDEDDIVWDINRGAGISLEKEGIIPKYLRLLFETRNDMKDTRNSYDPDSEVYKVWDARQNAVKVVMNSFYGVMSNNYWRLSSPELGDTVTAGARYVTWKGTGIAKELGYDIIYGDTDSIMVQIADPGEDISPYEVIGRGQELEDEINSQTEIVADDWGIGDRHPYLAGGTLHGTDRQCFTWEFEKLYRRFFQAGTKKRYSGLIFWKEESWLVDPEDADVEDADLDVTGYEAKRSDVPEITSEVQTEVMKRVLNGQEFDQLSNYIIDIVDKIENDNLPLRRIGMPGAINKALEDYPNRETPRACEYMNDHLDYQWGEGDNPWIYYVKSTPPMAPGTNVIALDWSEDIPDGFELDKVKHISKFVKDPIESVLEKAGYRFEELKSGKKTQAIEIESEEDTSSLFSNSGSTSSSSKIIDDDGEDNPFSTGKDSKEDNESESGALDW